MPGILLLVLWKQERLMLCDAGAETNEIIAPTIRVLRLLAENIATPKGNLPDRGRLPRLGFRWRNQVYVGGMFILTFAA